jgi:hypothetical protein
VVKLPSACIWRKGKDVVTSRVVLRFGNERYRAAVSLPKVDERSDGNGGVRKNSSVFGKRIGARYGQVPRTSQWVDAVSLPKRRPHCPFTLTPFLVYGLTIQTTNETRYLKPASETRFVTGSPITFLQ